MTKKMHQRICIRFCQILGQTCEVTYLKLQKVYGENCMSRSQVYDLFKGFKDGCGKNTENVERCSWIRTTAGVLEKMCGFGRSLLRREQKICNSCNCDKKFNSDIFSHFSFGLKFSFLNHAKH